MVQIGAGMAGFSLYALFMWMPIWRLANTQSPDGLFWYFVVVITLVFSVFMVSAGRSGFSFVRFVPAFVAGACVSAGFAASAWWLFWAGLIAVGITYVAFGE